MAKSCLVASMTGLAITPSEFGAIKPKIKKAIIKNKIKEKGILRCIVRETSAVFLVTGDTVEISSEERGRVKRGNIAKGES